MNSSEKTHRAEIAIAELTQILCDAPRHPKIKMVLWRILEKKEKKKKKEERILVITISAGNRVCICYVCVLPFRYSSRQNTQLQDLQINQDHFVKDCVTVFRVPEGIP